MSAKVPVAGFYDALVASGFDLFVGVPDSLLQDFVAYVEHTAPADRNIITANEGNAVALAGGYHVATGRFATVYLQNSGLGNTVNPLLSLADPAVYGLPMLLIVGWRGEPGQPDEPQHVTQGRLNEALLDAMEIEYQVVDPGQWQQQISWAASRMGEVARPVALVVRKGTFDKFSVPERPSPFELTREQALAALAEEIDPHDFIVSTTGKTSRELFEIREQRGEGHAHDFLTVGGMGHASSIAAGMCLGTKRLVYCIDGDGAFLMHMGGIAVAAQKSLSNFRYVLVNNGAHESVGGQPTVAFGLDLDMLLRSVGFDEVLVVRTIEDVREAAKRLSATPNLAVVIEVAQGSRSDLGRPTISPSQNKHDMMIEFQQESS